jgi:HD-GYP domain-containing protein (c-di-GMP phosphodiesterase class II)
MALQVGAGTDLTAEYRRLQASYQQALVYAREVRQLYARLQHASLQGLEGLANALEAKDAYTRGHSERVGERARLVALTLGWSRHETDVIGQAGRLHDIGKIGVPEQVLRKDGPLSPAEWEVMRGHPVIGAQIVSPFEFFADGALVIRHHHERYDGSGYPDGLIGLAIPRGARLVAVVDVYDALTSDRPYRGALSSRDAARELRRQAGRTLDAQMVEAFLAARQSR